MDTSPEYIKHCEKAVEIQNKMESYGLEQGSFFYRDGSILILSGVINLSLPPHIWLPRQGQLQEMVREEYENDYSLSMRFTKFIPGHADSSMEQLWLAFVMKEKHGKTWDGEDWVKSP